MSEADRNIAALRRVYDEWGRGNWRPWQEIYGPDMEWEWSQEFPDIHGRTGDPEIASARLREFLRQFDDWQAGAERFVASGDKVVVCTRYTGRGKGSGAAVDVQGAHVWTLRDGRATLLQIFSDRRTALEAAGLSPDS